MWDWVGDIASEGEGGTRPLYVSETGKNATKAAFVLVMVS